MSTMLDHHIEITPGFRGGRPRLAGTRITVADVAIMANRLGMEPALIAAQYNLALAAVHAALAYYFDHQVEMDQAIEADETVSEAFRRNNPSLLQAKLKALMNE